MSTSSTFLLGIGITLVMSLTIVTYLRNPLRKILTELCGTRDRADFWLAFSNTALVLTALICAATCRPDPEGSLVIQIATQLKWALAGALATLIVNGWVISRFIPRRTVTLPPAIPPQ